MAAQPRKDLKAVPSVRDAAASAKQTTPQSAPDGASLDTFNAIAGAAPAGAAGEATTVKAAAADARNIFMPPDERLVDDRDLTPPADEVPAPPAATARLGIAEATGAAAAAEEVQRAAEARQEPALSQFPRSSEAGNDSDSSAPEISATSATSAASAAGAVREAARQRLDPAISRDFTADQPGVTTEAPAAYADRLGISAGEMLERLNPDIVGRDAGIGEEQDVPAAFQNSGRDTLAARVDAVFDLGDDTGASAGTAGGVVYAGSAGGAFGRMGTPEDLGVTGDLGAKGDLGGSSGGGTEFFNVSLPGRGAASSSASELGILQGLLESVDTDTGVSVAQESGGVELLRQAIRDVQGETAPDPNAGKATDVDVVSKGQAGLPGRGAWYWDNESGEMRTADQVTESAKAAAAGDMTNTRAFNKSDADKVEGGTTKSGFNLFSSIGEALASFSEEGRFASEMEKKAATAQEEAAARDAAKQGGTAPSASQPVDPEGGDVAVTPGYLAWRAAARERLHIGQGGPGDIDPSDEGTDSVPSVGPDPGAQVFLQAGLQQKAMRDFLFGQPAGPEDAAGGRGSMDFGRLPGDMGNIDYGPDSTGAWTGDGRTESEADALNSLGGSGLSISDLHNTSDDSSDDQEDSDDAS
jgi:hypothetical protein